jgi:hypothetical protein
VKLCNQSILCFLVPLVRNKLNLNQNNFCLLLKDLGLKGVNTQDIKLREQKFDEMRGEWHSVCDNVKRTEKGCLETGNY